MMASSSLRSLPRIFEIFQSDPDPDAHLPSARGARWWLLRMGLYALREPLEQASDWVYIIDHSIQIGTLKLCLILGIRLSDFPSPSRPLRHSDMRLLALIPTEHSNGQIVLQQLENTSKRTGIPREILSDHGSDVKSGGELFVAAHAETTLVYDAAHYGAIVLKRLFQDCDVELAAHLSARPTALRHARVEAELITFARHESASARPGERLVGSSEVEEWVFGKLKMLEGDQCSSGFTRYVLSLGGVVGDWTTTRIKEALEKTPVKLVEAWCKEHLPISV